MKDNELLEKCHKGECICDGCERRFVCWTTKRVFSEPTYQALYEAYIAEGLSHEEAVVEVRETIERAIKEAALQEAMKQVEWDKDKYKDADIWKKKQEYVKWYDDSFKPYFTPKEVEFDGQDWKQIGIEDARKGIKDLEKYFRSMIHGKSTKR